MSRMSSLRRWMGAAALVTTTALPLSARAEVAEEGEKKGELMGIEMKIRHFTLANGMRVFVLEDHSTPMFSMHLGYGVGSRDEVEGRTGFAHFFEHMMYKGSANVPDGGHFRYVLGAGGKMNAFTTADRTQYHCVLPSHYLDLALWLESDRLDSLAVTEENFENQRQAVLEEKAMRIDNVPYTGALQSFFSDVWAGTGYGHSTIGSAADLNAAKVEDVKAFFDKYYVPNNAVLAIVGDVDYEEVKAKVDSTFGDIPRGEAPPKHEPIDHTQDKPLERTVADPLAQQPLYLVGWKTVPENHPDRHAVEIMMNALLRGDSARITRILQDEKKLVIASVPIGSASGGHDAGSAMAAFIPMPGKTFDDINAVINGEIATVKKSGITAKELSKAVNQITVDTVTSLGTNDGRADLIVTGALLYDDPTIVLSDLDKYRKVTVADIKRVANKYLTDNRLVLQVTPKK